MAKGKAWGDKKSLMVGLVILVVLALGLSIGLIIVGINSRNNAESNVEIEVESDEADMVEGEPDASSGTGATGSGEN